MRFLYMEMANNRLTNQLYQRFIKNENARLSSFSPGIPGI